MQDITKKYTLQLGKTILLSSIFFACSGSVSDSSLLKQADAAFEESRYPEAVILIGDSQLAMYQPAEAEKSYQSAKEKEVFPQLVADRFRQLAQYWFDNGDSDKAVSVLEKYRDLDPLAFDGLKDELHKQLIASEDESGE